MGLRIIPGYDYPEVILSLFTEYTEMLIASDEVFRTYLSMQNYEEEIQHLEDKYGYPEGRLYLALWDDEPAGCIALRRLSDECCEMKRLYVRPPFRGKKIGHALALQIIEDAKEIGYGCMLLDTLPFLQSAFHMYKKLGFYEIEPYLESPMKESIFMKLDL